MPTPLLRRPLTALLLAATLALGGCAGLQLDNDVQTFSSLPALPAQPAYRFERLPSQQNPQQDQVEAWADAALFKAGLRRDDANPRYSVLVSARVQRTTSPWDERFGPSWGVGGHLGTGHMGLSSFWRWEQPWFRREVSVILRELASNKVVYESHAASDGPWTDNAAILAPMFDAALQGFPAAPAGVRQVRIQVPGR